MTRGSSGENYGDNTDFIIDGQGISQPRSERILHELQKLGYKAGDVVDNHVLSRIKEQIRQEEYAKGVEALREEWAKANGVGGGFTVSLPPEVMPYRDDIRRFVDAMLYKLEKNAFKGKWETYTVDHAFELLRKEVDELQAEIGGNTIKTVLEAADVAVFALIVASIAVERGK